MKNYNRIEEAIIYIEDNYRDKPTIDDIAEHIGVSKFHFQRMFKEWAGITPIQFMNSLSLEYAKEMLTQSADILTTSYDAGLSGSGRLHDIFVNIEAVTPGEYKSGGAGLNIEYGFANTPFGECLLARTNRGICYLGFITTNKAELIQQVIDTYPNATFSENSEGIADTIIEIFKPDSQKSFNLALKGTNFQVNVWRALLMIPEGSFVTYETIAKYLGMPKAYRAVASAIAVNPVGYLIPCHRVIAKSGIIHKYRWGSSRKKAMFVAESNVL